MTRRVGAACLTLAVGLVGPGALGVRCAIRPIPEVESPAATADERLATRVERALSSATDVAADRISLETRDGVVTVTGTVASGLEQQTVGAIVRAVPGVREVRCSLVIRPEDPS